MLCNALMALAVTAAYPEAAPALTTAKQLADMKRSNADSYRRDYVNNRYDAIVAWSLVQDLYNSTDDPALQAQMYLALEDALSLMDQGDQCVMEGGDPIYQNALALYRTAVGLLAVGNGAEADQFWLDAAEAFNQARFWYDQGSHDEYIVRDILAPFLGG